MTVDGGATVVADLLEGDAFAWGGAVYRVIQVRRDGAAIAVAEGLRINGRPAEAVLPGREPVERVDLAQHFAACARAQR